MSMLRSDTELSLDRVTETCKLAADHYRSVRAAVHAPALAALFAHLEADRRGWSARLEEAVRRTGNLPSAPDADREALDHLAVRLRAAFSRDEEEALIASCDQVEADLAEAARSALEHSLPQRIRDDLHRLGDSVQEARRSLAAARGGA